MADIPKKILITNDYENYRIDRFLIRFLSLPKSLIHKDLRKSAKLIVNWITSELFAILKKNNLEIHNSPISADYLGRLIKLIISEKISGKIAKEVFEDMFITQKDPNIIVKEKNLVQLTDSNEIEKIIEKILQDNQDKVNDYLNGKKKLLGYFIGVAMKESKGKANPKVLNKILIDKLNQNQ